MALDGRTQAAIALNRFGFMPKADVPSDPRAALLADLAKTAGQIANHELPSVGEAARATFAFRQERKEERLEKAATARGDMAGDDAKSSPTASNAKPDMAKEAPGVPQQIYLQEAKARLDAALSAEIGFVERLVWFWSNHFCVSADKGPVRSLCGAFEREAIRPHVRGKFADMLLAVETHPAMLLYLDNAQSIGPHSFAGQRRGKGINERISRARSWSCIPSACAPVTVRPTLPILPRSLQPGASCRCGRSSAAYSRLTSGSTNREPSA
jgi:uncharacterized protein (DUF1800 family)